MTISDDFFICVKRSRLKGYEIERRAFVYPGFLSKVLAGRVSPDDERLKRIADVLDFPPDCIFEDDPQTTREVKTADEGARP